MKHSINDDQSQMAADQKFPNSNVFIFIACSLLLLGSYKNLERLIGNHGYVTRFFCAISFQQCMAYEKPGAGLGVFVTLRQNYKNSILLAQSPGMISSIHLQQLSKIQLLIGQPPDIDISKIKVGYTTSIMRMEFRPTVYVPRDKRDLKQGDATYVTIFISNENNRPEMLYLIEDSGEYYIIPDSLIGRTQ